MLYWEQCICITWELLRNAHSWFPRPQPTESESTDQQDPQVIPMYIHV